MMQSSVVTETWPLLGRGFWFPRMGSNDSQRGGEFATGISHQNSPEQMWVNIREFKSSAHISLKSFLPIEPPKTKSLEPTKVVVW